MALPTKFTSLSCPDRLVLVLKRTAAMSFMMVGGTRISDLREILPGLLLCLSIALAAFGLELLELRLTGKAWIEALIIAILAGAVIRSFWTPGAAWEPGIKFSGKTLLEIAIVLLGASLSVQAIASAGPVLFAAIVAAVFATLGISYGLGCLLGLPKRVAILIAAGNSICGNSAIAAVAPIIGAKPQDVASSISFTAVLGVVAVLLLPLLAEAIDLTDYAYGVLAGLTVYAVPQVLAATMPVSALAAQVGTLVKLVRVLMLGPVLLALSFLRLDPGTGEGTTARPPLHRLVPWFIIGFLLLAAARSAGWIGEPLVVASSAVSGWLTVLAMAALGLGVDIRSVAKAGPRVTLVVTLSLAVLTGLSLALIWMLRLT